VKTDVLGNVLGLPFTPEQLEAITAPPEPAVIVAGAGSGKTTVMAARVVWLVASGAVRPDQVLGLTFTNKAAGELGHRLRVALARLDRWGSRNGPGGTSASDGEERAGEPTVLTYHAYAARLLGEHGLRIGVEPEARLLADATRYQLAARVIRGAPGPFTAVTGRVSDVVGDLVALDAELSEHLVAPDELRAYDQAVRKEIAAVPEPATDLQRVVAAIDKRAELASLIDAYRHQKGQRSVVDFADQMAFAATLAEQRPEVGRAERDRYRVVLLDEYQDTSVAQRRLLAGLFGGGHPVTAVGDPCQAIYGWRGASVANLQDFPRHFPRGDGTPAHRYGLTENRRSGERILAAANELSLPLRRSHRAIPPLRPGPDGADRGWIRCALHETYSEEIEWVGDQVAGAIAEGVPPAEIAILVRVTSDCAPIHSELTSRNIPVEVVGLGGLLSLPEVADVVAVLRVLDDPTSNAALVRLLSGPRWRIGPRDLAMLGRRAAQLVTVPASLAEGTHPSVSAAPAESSAGAADAVLEEAVGGIDPAEVVSLADALTSSGQLSYSAEARDRFAALAKEIRDLRRHLGEPLLDLLHQVVLTIGLDVELAASPQSRAARRRESLAAFFDVAAQFRDLEDDTSLAAFLAYLDAADEHDRGLDSAAPTGAESVKLLTVHKAKGLEWEVVLLPDLTATVFPSGRGRTRWTRSGKVLPYPLRGDAGSVPEVAGWTRAGLAAFDQACKDVDELEERRLGYVAVTRPRRLLIASSHWWGMSQKKRRGPSPYLKLLIAQCRSGAGEVARWVDEPDEELENPYLEATAEAAWPVPLEPGALQLRRAAADLVRSLLAAEGRSAAVDGSGDARDVRPGAYEQLALLELPSSAACDPDSFTPAEAAQVAGWDRDVALLLGEARRLRKRNREVEMPTTLSASQLMRVADDPDGFARELARPMPRKPDPAARRGTRFHAWVEARFGQQPLLDEDELPGAADAEIADEADLTALRRSFEHTDYAERLPHAVEAPFQLLLAGHVVRGRIDAVYETDDGGFEVIDWKTGREQSADPLQLAIYRLAWAEMHSLPVDRVHAAFAYIRSGETVRHDDLPGREELEAILSVGAAESAGSPPVG
jgi:DNA helicase II / ATP-dependent DNA helicase PcrA